MTGAYTDDPGLYSIVRSDLAGDVGPIVALLADAGGPVLELCCGNGRILVPARQAGIDVDGLDLSEPMLDDLRAELGRRGLQAGVHHGDMRAFALPRRYAVVLIAFNSFLHNLTQADQLATLRRCREHLAPGGRLALIVFHPDVDVHWAFQIRYVFKPEMELLLQATGFERWTIRPLEFSPDGRASFVDRAPREGEVLLWTARVEA